MKEMKEFLKKNWIVIVCACVAISGIVWCFYRAAEMDKARPHYDRNNPEATQWGELAFIDLTNHGEALPLCTELTAEGEGKFASGTEYLVRFHFPDGLRAEVENGHDDYETDIRYSFQVTDGSYGYLRIEIYNQYTHKMYIGESSFEAVGDICLKHDFGATPDLGQKIDSEPINFVGADYLEFTLYTSATPDDGPKSSNSAWKAAPVWRIMGIEGEF